MKTRTTAMFFEFCFSMNICWMCAIENHLLVIRG